MSRPVQPRAPTVPSFSGTTSLSRLSQATTLEVTNDAGSCGSSVTVNDGMNNHIFSIDMGVDVFCGSSVPSEMFIKDTTNQPVFIGNQENDRLILTDVYGNTIGSMRGEVGCLGFSDFEIFDNVSNTNGISIKQHGTAFFSAIDAKAFRENVEIADITGSIGCCGTYSATIKIHGNVNNQYKLMLICVGMILYLIERRRNNRSVY